MVYYSPWMQGADYTRSPDYAYRNVLAPTGTAERVYPGATAPYDDELNDALDGTGPTTTAMAGPGVELKVTGAGPVPNTSPPEIKFGTSMAQGGAEWDTANLLDVTYYQALIEPSMPANAYGVEFESGPVVPVAANLHIEVTTDAQDSTLPAGSPQSMVGASLYMTIRGGTTYAGANVHLVDVSLQPGMAPAVFDFDLTGLMGPQGQCGISTNATKDAPWGYYNPNSLGIISLSGSADTRMVYTLHPPRHRWLYNTPPGVPPLRQMASDARAASSAARIFPTSAEQSSLRRHGYF